MTFLIISFPNSTPDFIKELQPKLDKEESQVWSVICQLLNLSINSFYTWTMAETIGKLRTSVSNIFESVKLIAFHIQI